jgi:hypothetical protein
MVCRRDSQSKEVGEGLPSAGQVDRLRPTNLGAIERLVGHRSPRQV